MNKSVNGLKKIYLIKSAGYEFAEIALHDNTLLLGDSGVGKTTIMRAVLFFYTMDYSDSILNINPDTKKSFNDWYFREHNSHLIYEYAKDESRFLFIVSKSGKLHYSFVDITNATIDVQELFLDGNMPVNLERLNENIQTNSLPNYTTTIKEKYINAFHKKDSDNKNIKQESSSSFVLFESINSRKEFAKTLSNIFASSKVSSNSLKKSIVSLIADSTASINLNEIKSNLNEFIKERQEIEKFEKKFPTILKLADTHAKYKENKQEFKIKANELESVKKSSNIKIEENAIESQRLEKDKSELKFNYEVAFEISKATMSNKEKEIWNQEKEIEELSKKDEEYKKKNIDSLIIEQNSEEAYTASLLSAQERFNALTSGAADIKSRYKQIQEKLNQDANNNVLKVKTLSHENIEKINSKINETIQSKENKIKESSAKYINEKNSLDLSLSKINILFGDTKILQAKAEFFPFNEQNINLHKDEVQEFEKELSDTKYLLKENSHEIKIVEQEIANIQTQLKISMDKLDDDIRKQKETLFNEKFEIEKKLDFESENLYGFLNKNNINNKEKIVTYLKDEILFSDKRFSATQKEDLNSVFGLELTFEKEFSNEYQQGKLLESLRVIKEKLKDLNKKVQNEKKILDDDAQKETKEKNRRRSAFYATKSNLEEKEKSYSKSFALSKENLVHAQEKAKIEKTLEMDKLNNKYSHEELEIKKLEESIELIKQKIDDVTSSITQSTNQTISECQERINALKLSEKSDIQSIGAKYKEESQVIQDELSEALTEQGVDDKLLKEISAQTQQLESTLQAIHENRTLVTVYVSEYQEKIKTIPSKRETLQNNKRLKNEFKAEMESIKAKYKKESAEVDGRKKELDEIKSNLEKFLKNYNEKIENQNIALSVKKSLTLENFILEKEIEIKDMVENIVHLYDKIKSEEEKIKSFVLECEKALELDNIFKIEISNDYVNSIEYLRHAKELIAYIQKDKITPFKDMASETFKSSLNSIKKELGIFENAILDVESEITTLGNTINKAVNSFNVIDNIKIRFESSNNNALNSLKTLSSFYDENNDKFLGGLYKADMNDASAQKMKEELGSKILDLVELLKTSKASIELEDGFVLEFKVTENGNDLKWRQTLNDVGSNGTSTLVKSIINVSMLQMVSKNIVKENQILSHCILDEIGTISTDYFKELKDFVNRSGFVFLNGMPIEDDMLISMYPTIYVGQNQGRYSRMILASKMEI